MGYLSIFKFVCMGSSFRSKIEFNVFLVNDPTQLRQFESISDSGMQYKSVTIQQMAFLGAHKSASLMFRQFDQNLISPSSIELNFSFFFELFLTNLHDYLSWMQLSGIARLFATS